MVEVITKRQAQIYIKEEVERQIENKAIKLIDMCFKKIQKLQEEITILQKGEEIKWKK